MGRSRMHKFRHIEKANQLFEERYNSRKGIIQEQELLRETEELSDSNIQMVDEHCANTHGSTGFVYYLRGSWNGLYHNESRIQCTKYPPGPSQASQHANWTMHYLNHNHLQPQYGMEVWSPPTPDFDDAFYDKWEGDYGYHPGHGITPDKVIPGKTPNVMGKKQMKK